MEKFLVPQYIDVEPKILGPITIRQFIEMMISGFISFIFYKLFYFTTFIILALINTAIALIIAFFKINGMPFHFFILNVIQTMKKPRLRIWQKQEITALPPEEKIDTKTDKVEPKKPIEESKLTSLSLMIDTGGAYNAEEWKD